MPVASPPMIRQALTETGRFLQRVDLSEVVSMESHYATCPIKAVTKQAIAEGGRYEVRLSVIEPCPYCEGANIAVNRTVFYSGEEAAHADEEFEYRLHMLGIEEGEPVA